jgi:hypothetical protein
MQYQLFNLLPCFMMQIYAVSITIRIVVSIWLSSDKYSVIVI